jgi:hypothetical protein
LPPKIWTAWPLPADEVPRTGEQIGPTYLGARDTLRREEEAEPSHEIEDVLTSITLRLAKEAFHMRDWEEEEELPVGAMKGEADVDIDASKLDKHETGSGNEEESQHNSDADENGDQDQVAPLPPQDFRSSENVMHQTGWSQMDIDDDALPSGSEVGSSESELLENLPSREEILKRPEPPVLQPIITADDEKSRKLLHPTVRNTLSRLDELLMAMHHTRQSCFRYGSESDSQSEHDGAVVDDSDDGKKTGGNSRSSSKGPKRAVGRPRNIYDVSATVIEVSAHAGPDLTTQEPKKSKRGRPKQIHTPLEGETNTEMLVRIARKQKKPIRFIPLAPPDEQSSSPLKLSPSRSRRRSSSPSQSKVLLRLGLRDWSEVMGTAALVGYSPDVIARATQRCASLFGEGMKMRHLDLNSKENTDLVINYVPDAIPDLPVSENSGNESGDITIAIKHQKFRRRPSRKVGPLAVKSEPETPEDSSAENKFWCPYHDCIRHLQGFKRSDHVRSHLKRAHKLSNADVDKALQGSDDEIENGLHVDGFLKPLKKRPWRGLDGGRRSRSISTARKGRSKVVSEDDNEDESEFWDSAEDNTGREGDGKESKVE